MRGLLTVLLLFVLIAAAGGAAFWYLRYVRAPSNVAYITEEDGGITMVDLATMQIAHRIRLAKLNPRGLALTRDGEYLVTSNKNTADLAVFSTPRLHLLQRFHVGANPEFLKMGPTGDTIFATFEPGSSGGPPKSLDAQTKQAGRGGRSGAAAGGQADKADDDDDANAPPAQIATFHVGDWTPGPVMTAGKETEGLEFSPDGNLMLVANEAQDSLGIFDRASHAHIRDFDLKPYGIRPRGIKKSPLGSGYALTMEATGTLLLLDLNLTVTKSVPTAEKPYGVAFDRAGKRIFVSAAAARKLQVFAADTLKLLAEVPTGQRCWHFTFTPDDSKVLLACGRSNNVVIIDANSYQPLGTIEGLKLPWGIVTYPASFGSLGLP